MLYWWNLPQLCIFMRVETEKPLEPENHFFFELNLIASLVKLLYKLDQIWRSIPWETTQARFEMITTLTSLKVEPKLLSSKVMQL